MTEHILLIAEAEKKAKFFILFFAVYTASSQYLPSVLRIRIRIRIHRIHMFLGLLDPDPDPSVRGMDPLSPSKKSKENLDFYCFVTSLTSFWLFIFKNDVHVPLKSNKQKTFFLNKLFVAILGRSMTKIAGSGSASGSGSGSESGSISQRHGSADPDPDPDQPQNVMDPQHWLPYLLIVLNMITCWRFCTYASKFKIDEHLYSV